MCCLSKASSHFVVFVCENPDRKPSRKMKRRNINRLVELTISRQATYKDTGLKEKTYDKLFFFEVFIKFAKTCLYEKNLYLDCAYHPNRHGLCS